MEDEVSRLQECPEYHELRKKNWSIEVTMNHKLNGTKKELQTTVEFIIRTYLAVYVNTRRKEGGGQYHAGYL